MEEATKSAEIIRKDIQAFRTRYINLADLINLVIIDLLNCSTEVK